MTTKLTVANHNHVNAFKHKRGFSLIEIIVVIVILGVLAVGISTFISFGTQIYTDATDRDEVVSSARFAIERLNREVRAAVPNSIRVTTNNLTGATAKQCIEFTPLILSAIYTDIAVAPEPETADIKVIAFDETLFNSGFAPNLAVGVYVLDADDFYNGGSNKIYTLQDGTITKVGNEWTISLNSAQNFTEDSPTNRLYFFNQPVSYCVQNEELRRFYNYTRNADNTPSSAGVLMAENISMHEGTTLIAPFTLTKASQLRNSMVLVKLAFSINNERVVFNNEVQVSNVP